ncbi:hypothetical protein [Kitasatospora phosalacinea]|uniref:Uncharacterized protein n=1 Tax=Kitasatospora phosalacinea TaxID=2065 RepID=A0A9W6UKM4_9ACTN|nr:hypothetical protein [Kitasatospora phosalacinea]GLW53546.1 hypothetical protein Kpho01_15570 [Kitasatospora phosalacinea]
MTHHKSDRAAGGDPVDGDGLPWRPDRAGPGEYAEQDRGEEDGSEPEPEPESGPEPEPGGHGHGHGEGDGAGDGAGGGDGDGDGGV